MRRAGAVLQVAATPQRASRRRRCRLTGVLLGAMATSILVLSVATSAQAAFVPCKPYVFLGARGSGEPAPTNKPNSPDLGHYGVAALGKPLAAEFGKLRALLGSNSALLEARSVAYDATHVKPNSLEAFGMSVGLGGVGLVAGERALAYGNSVDQGKRRLRAEIENIARLCDPSTRIILAGYSQGAHVVGDVLSGLTGSLRARVLATTNFGDPRFNPLASAEGDFEAHRHGLLGSRGQYPPDTRADVQSWCIKDDPVCQGIHSLVPSLSLDPFHVYEHARAFFAHAEYPNYSTVIAATWLLQRIRKNEKTKGVAPPDVPAPTSRPLDVAFVVDTTASMDDAISSVRGNLALIRERLALSATDLRTALAEYKDGPEESSDYRSRLDTGLTADASAFATAVDRLDARGGGDFPESVFSGLQLALDLPWRPDAAKFVVLVGDAPPKDPEPGTGLTVSAITTSALRIPVPVYTLQVRSDPDTTAAFTDLAARTSGRSYSVDEPAAVAAAILTAIDEQARTPSVRAAAVRYSARSSRATVATAAQAGEVVSAGIGEPLLLSAANISSPVGEDLAFIWDFGDGTSLSTRETVISHTWAAPFIGDVRITVIDESGRSAQALRPVHIAGAPFRAVTRQPRPVATRANKSVVLRWRRPATGQPVFYEVRSGRRVIAITGAASDSRGLRLAVRRLPNNRPVTFTITAWDAKGRSASSPPSRAVTPRARRSAR
jgi:hypothetical protein